MGQNQRLMMVSQQVSQLPLQFQQAMLITPIGEE